jgi:hypothetical protein
LAIALIALLVVAGLGLGVLVARQQPPGRQSSLAIVTIARNLGLALLIAAPLSIWSKPRCAPAAD